MIPKKKPSGLAKKIPAIFEGLPDVEDLGRRGPGSVAVQAPSAKPAKNPLLLMEAGVSSFKAALVQVESKKIMVGGLFSTKFVNSDPSGMPEPAVLKPILEKCLQEFRLTRPVPSRLLVRGSGTSMLRTEKPDAPAKQIKEALVWQLAEKISFPVERSEICYQEQAGTMLAAAMDMQVRDKVLESFHAAGIFPEAIVPLPVLYEPFQQKKTLAGSPNVLIVDLAESQCSLVLFLKGRFELFREAPYGYEQVLKAMKGTLMVENTAITIDSQEAEALLAEFGLPTPNLVIDPQEPKLSQLSARIRPVFEKIVQEIRSTLTLSQKQMPAEKIEEICLSGAGEGLKGFDQYLANQLSMPVRRMDVKIWDSRLDGSWAGIIGLGLTGSTPFNFAPFEDAIKPKLDRAASVVRMLTVWSALALAAAGFLMGSALAVKAKALAAQKKNFSALVNQNQKIAWLETLKNQVAQRRQLLEAEALKPMHHGAVFREISRLMPPDLLLTQISFQAGPAAEAAFSGRVLPGSENADSVISGFLEKLNQSPFFDRSALDSRSADPEKGTIEFLVRADLVPPEEGHAS